MNVSNVQENFVCLLFLLPSHLIVSSAEEMEIPEGAF